MEKSRIYLLLLVVFFNNGYAQEASYSSTVLAPGYNQLSFDAPIPGSYTLSSYKAASNGDVIDVDGHDLAQLIKAFDSKVEGWPMCIIANTIKGKGVSFMENQVLWHYRSPQGEEFEAAMKELDNA